MPARSRSAGPDRRTAVWAGSVLAIGLLIGWSSLRLRAASGAGADIASATTHATKDATPVPLAGETAASESMRIAASDREPLPSAAGRTLCIATIDGNGVPVPDSLVRVDDGGRERDVGTTGADGRLWLGFDPSWRPSHVVVASHASYAAAVAPLVAVPGDTITLVMHRAGTIRGSVAWLDGAPVGAGIRVAAFTNEERFAGETHLARLVRGASSVHRTTTDTSSAFELTGLDETRRWSVIATWDGCASRNMPNGVPVGADDVRLELGMLFGVHLSFVDRGTGEPIELPEQFLQEATCKGVLGTKQVVPLPFHPRWTRLAGIHSRFNGAFSGRDTTFLFIGPQDLQSAEPFDYDFRFPGYERATGRVALTPASAEVVEHRVLLTRKFEDAPSTLRIELNGIAEGVPADRAPVGPELRLLLQTWRGNLSVAVPIAGNGAVEIPHAPAGPIRWGLVSYSTSSLFDMRGESHSEVAVDGTTSTRIVADLSGSGALEIELVQVDGSKYLGPARFQFDFEREGEPAIISQPAFERAPYAFVALGPGSYSLRLTSPAPRDDEKRLVVVRAGELAHVVEPVR